MKSPSLPLIVRVFSLIFGGFRTDVISVIGCSIFVPPWLGRVNSVCLASLNYIPADSVSVMLKLGFCFSFFLLTGIVLNEVKSLDTTPVNFDILLSSAFAIIPSADLFGELSKVSSWTFVAAISIVDLLASLSSDLSVSSCVLCLTISSLWILISSRSLYCSLFVSVSLKAFLSK